MNENHTGIFSQDRDKRMQIIVSGGKSMDLIFCFFLLLFL